MNPILAAILGGLSASFETIGEGLLIGALQKMHDNNPEEFAKDIPVILAFAKRLKVQTDGSASKLDDPFADALVQAIEASMAANGITA